ncbi:MAG: hypothetical protein ACLFQK_01875 [Fibrobacterota bacterium]
MRKYIVYTVFGITAAALFFINFSLMEIRQQLSTKLSAPGSVINVEKKNIKISPAGGKLILKSPEFRKSFLKGAKAGNITVFAPRLKTLGSILEGNPPDTATIRIEDLNLKNTRLTGIIDSLTGAAPDENYQLALNLKNDSSGHVRISNISFISDKNFLNAEGEILLSKSGKGFLLKEFRLKMSLPEKRKNYSFSLKKGPLRYPEDVPKLLSDPFSFINIIKINKS